jgi:hypothetical protein
MIKREEMPRNVNNAPKSYLKSDDQEKLARAITELKNLVSQLFPTSFEAQQVREAYKLLESIDIDLRSAYETWYTRLKEKNPTGINK